MAKYHELCDAWAEAVAAAADSKKACDDFARAIANGLEDFLEAPAHRVVYLPFENAEKQMGQSLRDVGEFDEETGDYRFGLGVWHCDNPEATPSGCTKVQVELRREVTSTYKVKLNDQDEFIVRRDEAEDMRKLFEVIYQKIHDYWLNRRNTLTIEG